MISLLHKLKQQFSFCFVPTFGLLKPSYVA